MGYTFPMNSVAIVSIVFSVVTIVVVLGGFFWAARADGRYQREHEKHAPPNRERTSRR